MTQQQRQYEGIWMECPCANSPGCNVMLLNHDACVHRAVHRKIASCYGKCNFDASLECRPLNKFEAAIQNSVSKNDDDDDDTDNNS